MRWPWKRRRQPTVHPAITYWDRQFEWAERRDPMEPLDLDATVEGAWVACGQPRPDTAVNPAESGRKGLPHADV